MAIRTCHIRNRRAGGTRVQLTSDDDEYALRVGNHRELSKLQTAPEELVLRTLSRCVEIFQRSQPSQHISRWGNLVCRGAVATGRIRALLRKVKLSTTSREGKVLI